MSAESTHTSPAVNPTTPDAAPAAQLEATLAATAEQQAKRNHAAETLTQCVAEYTKGGMAMREGSLAAGRLASQYVAERMALGDKRQAAIDVVTLELSKAAGETVDASVVIRAYQAYTLLNAAAFPDKPETVLSYGHYARVLTQLVTRQEGERWTLLPGFEAQAAELFRSTVVNHFTQAVCKEHCTKLHKAYSVAQQEQAERDAKAALEKADTQKAEHDKAVAAQKAAEQAEKAAKDAAAKAADADRERLTQLAEQAKAEKLAAQRKAVELASAKRQADADASKAEASRKAAEKAANRAVSGPKPKPTAPEQPKPQPESRDTNPVAMAKHGTAKDVAALVRDMICANKPADVLRELAICFDWRVSDAQHFANGIASNPGKQAPAFAEALATALINLLPAGSKVDAA